nr:protein moonraker-like [Nerophis lumbriciformis]
MSSIEQQTHGKEWVVLPSNRKTQMDDCSTNGTSQNKLLFNEAVPPSIKNRATAVGPPAAIVIEKLLPLPSDEQQKDTDSVKSSINFTMISEEKLRAAVELAKRDLQRLRFRAMCGADPPEDASMIDVSNVTLPRGTTKLSVKDKMTRPGSKQPASKRNPVPSKRIGRLYTSSSPAAGVDQHYLLRQEVYKLQNELESLKKGLNPKVNRLGHKKPEDATKEPPVVSRRHIPRPSSKIINRPTDVPDNRRDMLMLQNELLKHSDNAFSFCVQDLPITVGQQDHVNQEMHKLDAELENYIRQVEKLSDRHTLRAQNEHSEEDELEPSERQKLELRWQRECKRAARSIYALQQQIKEIQRYIEKLHNQDIWDAKKSTAIQRLAGVHRSTRKALQAITRQLAEQYHSKLPSHCGSLSRLLCQLTLCSARIQVDPGSPMPEMAADILRKLEILDCAISKHEIQQALQIRACPPQRKQSTYPCMLPTTRAPKGSGAARGLPKSANQPRSYHARRMMTNKRRELDRSASLKRAPQQLKKSPSKKEHQPPKVKRMKWFMSWYGNLGKQDAHFKEPTVSSRLRVNQPPHREPSVPWIPASSHSLSPPRSHHKATSEPRCLSSPVKPSSSSSLQKPSVGFSEEVHLSSETNQQAQKEALRGAWLDKTTMQRLEDLNQLTREEALRIERLRAEAVSPTEWAKQAEQQARMKIRPLLDEAEHLAESWSRSRLSLGNRPSEQHAKRGAERGEQTSEILPGDLLEEAAQHVLQAPTLEGMLQRMEEIQRDREEVRRRVASINYSEAPQWEQSAGSQVQILGSRPSSPQPIRLTRPVLRQPTVADIVVKEPVERGILSETSSLLEEASREEGLPIFPVPQEGGEATTVLSVPAGILDSIRHYQDDYEEYLRRSAHEHGSGDVNFWSCADSLADELLQDAVADVAAEFQDVMEECAEAVFTAEFLQLIHSPRIASSSSVNQ